MFVFFLHSCSYFKKNLATCLKFWEQGKFFLKDYHIINPPPPPHIPSTLYLIVSLLLQITRSIITRGGPTHDGNALPPETPPYSIPPPMHGTHSISNCFRLRDLLLQEEAQHMMEMAAKEETVLERQAKMRTRAKQLKEQREAERMAVVHQKLEQQFK